MSLTISKKIFSNFILLLTAIFLVSCATAPSVPSAFSPKGPAAAQINDLWWIMFGLGTAVYVVVMGLLLLALFRRKKGALARNGRRLILIGGLVVPVIVLAIVYGFTLTTLNALSPSQHQSNLTIEVTGHQWWWEVRYPDQQIITANEIHIPVGQPVSIKLASADVIHSFWVPELHGKLDMIPGRVNDFWLQADEPGEYWGLCAEFCGTQHAKMLFVVVAQPEAQFNEWLAQQQQPATTPASGLAQQGLDVFIEADCGRCHAIDGTDATGRFGPDLTHFASRLTLGAGAVRNTQGALAGWVIDPHGVKPGNLMPSADISGPDLQALLAYLESLE